MIKELTMEKTSLPAGWEMKKLIELGEVQTGTTPSTSNKGFYGDFIPFVKPPHFNPDGTISFSSSGLSAIGLAKGRLIKENSILMVCIGASIGKTGITPIPISCNQQINAFSPNENCLPKFYYHLLSSDYFFKKVMKRSSQATLPMINKTKWQNIEIPLPPLPQQKQIVATLDKAFAAIDTAKANAEQNLQNAKELFESYLQNVFENKGDDWDEKSLGEVCEINPKKSEVNNLPTNHLVSFLPMKDLGVAQNKISSTKIKQLSEVKGSYTYFRNNDVLLAKVTPCFENGKLGIAKGLKNKIGFGSSEYIVFRPKELILSEYLFYILSSNKFRNKGKKLMFGTTGLKRLSKDYVQSFTAPLPSLEKQLQLVKKLDALSSEIKKLEAIYTQKIADLEEMKKSVLQKAFSGQLKNLNQSYE